MYKIISLIFLSVLLSGCAVVMAANKKGVDVNEVTSCKTRACITGKGAELVQSLDGEGGTLVETYKILKPQGSAGRAVMHGVLDLATLGIWEVAGTPIEGAMNEDDYTAIRVLSDKLTGDIKKIELPQ